MKRNLWIVGSILLAFLFSISIRLLLDINQNKLFADTDSDSQETDQFVKIYKDKIHNLIKELEEESLEESFSNLINDQQYYYPGYHTPIKGTPVELETLFSSRRFLKVFQQFQFLPQNQANALLDKFCKQAIDEYKIAVLETRNPKTTTPTTSDSHPKTSKPHNLKGAKNMIYTSMLLAAHNGNCLKVWEQFEKTNQIIQEEKKYIEEKNKNKELDKLDKLLISVMSFDRDCITNIFMYAFSQTKNNSDLVIKLKSNLNQKEVPLVKWDAKVTYYDFLHCDIFLRSGNFTIDNKTVIQNFTVYSLPRYGDNKSVNFDEIVKLFKSELKLKP
jgi:hypothetical protein